MADGNWWESSSSRNRFESASSPSSTAMNSLAGGSFGWPTDILVDAKASSSSMDSASISNTSILFNDSRNKLQPNDNSPNPSLLTNPNLQMMGLALSSQVMDWNQTLLRGEKAESSFRSMIQEDMSTNASFQLEQDQWSARQKFYSGSSNEELSTNRGFSLEPQQSFTSHISPRESSTSTVTCQGLDTSYQMDYTNPSAMLHGLLGSNNHPQQQESNTFEINRSMNYPYQQDYGMKSSNDHQLQWSKVPQFLRGSPPKQPPLQNQIHFSNNAPIWNASNDVHSGIFPSLQMQLPSSNFDEKPKNTLEVRDIVTVGAGKKSSSEASSKRTRNEAAPSPMPPFKVRKEKMGDRITALQQLVSPFGKTDTASVLSEAIEYIKFLHDQVSVLSSPYLKSGATPQHHQQVPENCKNPEAPNQDLRSRGLCLVPVSSTYPVTHETAVDFWTPTFGGTFR